MALVGADEHETGNSPDEWLGRVHPEDLDQLTRELEIARTGAQAFAFRHRLRHANGSYRWMSCRGGVVRDPSGIAIRLTGAHNEATSAAVADPVTGLPNRSLLADRLARALERDARYGHLPFALLLVGLERGIEPASSNTTPNATLLTALARRLETGLRQLQSEIPSTHQHLVARLEDDHFAILLEGLHEIGDSKTVADWIVADLRSPLVVGARQVFASASIGIAVSLTGYTSADAVLRDAETALHRAHALGGGRSEVFDTAVLESEQTVSRLEKEMPGALQRGEFALDYQPIVSLASRQIVGFEALVRWRHPNVGLIPPSDFIPSAERTGFIVPLGRWILREAVAQLKAWREGIPAAADACMSVNLSSVQLADTLLVDDIAAILNECQLPPRSLLLELTESVACDNPMAVKTVLMQLRALGIRISIDDFGTGYSSLSYLREFPVDALKIDRSFVRGLRAQDERATIIGSVTGMARQLGLSVVAEGVEHEEQLTLLQSLGCDSGQGYLFARPLDAEAAANLLKTGLHLPAERIRPTDVAGEARLFTRRLRRTLRGGWHWLLVAAGMVVVLAMAGVRTWLAQQTIPPADPVHEVVIERSAASPRGELSTPATSVAEERGPSDLDTVHGRAPVDSLPEKPSLAMTSPRPPDAIRTTFSVQHLHRMGRCVGRLELSRRGLAFAPEDAASNEGFVLPYEEFLSSIDNRTLTIKSNTKQYRFRVKDGRPESGNAKLRQVADAIARLR
jgi:EAL domain-containing protein (putative c-di-GMP-specific phosphodiesterase class I)/GGDEF domain-containing protein